jgi:rod shape-determining protein MreC
LKGFLKSNSFRVLIIVICVVTALMILSDKTGSKSLGSLLGIMTTPMKEVDTELQSKLSNTDNSLSDENSALKDENAQLRSQLEDYYTLKEENDQYKEALGIKQQHEDFSLQPAKVISRDVTDPFYSFTIDKGTSDGLSKGDPVITNSGLVGVVAEVFTTSSTITTIFSEDLQVGAICNETTESGVITSNAESTADGLVKLNYLPKETKITTGSIITTSGAGGIYPAGIVIGEVKYLGESKEDVSVYAMVQPYEDIKNVSTVFVVTDFNGKTNKSEVTASSKTESSGD